MGNKLLLIGGGGHCHSVLDSIISSGKYDEIGIIDEINDFDMSNTLECVPQIVSEFMADTGRKFDLPAPDSKTCPATISTQYVPEETKKGVSKLGGVEKEWTSTIAAHDVVKVKNHTKAFKK